MKNTWLKNKINEDEKEIEEILLLKFPDSHILKDIILPNFNQMIKELKIIFTNSEYGFANSAYGSSFSPPLRSNNNLERNIGFILERLKGNLKVQEERRFYEKVFIDRVFWRVVSGTNGLNESFIEEYKELLDLNTISKHQDLSYEFVFRNKEILNFELLSRNKNIKDGKLRTFVEINNI
ncbi:hypothetical protein Bp8pS_064 [Bacillus phage vB_BpuM-BpSp]|nr:hypothetical protein Bp8pS_064 [Bacillus phage vB_BpuM-BpSp]